MTNDQFHSSFLSLTGYSPFPWQTALYQSFTRGEFPSGCALPTGLGKTSVMAVWLLALATRGAHGPVDGYPRRLVWVVNRRTVVDQATAEAERLRYALESDAALQRLRGVLAQWVTVPGTPVLGISTLRGQFEDNAEWRNDPGRPAICVGTVDMVGSRLLFAGYGRGFRSRPLHAAFIGHDSLVVHDEAHLEPAFQALLEGIVRHRAPSEKGRFAIIALTATPRKSGSDTLVLTREDLEHAVVAKRVQARKGLAFVEVPDTKNVVDGVLGRALAHRESGRAILVFVRTLEGVTSVASRLAKHGLRTQVLTGTLRGFERDALASADEVFARFLPNPRVTPAQGTVYLVCTSAGEVGIDMSGDHLVCDMVPFDSLAQRLGRVNRFGDGDALVDVVVSPAATAETSESKGDDDIDAAPAGSQNAYERATEAARTLVSALPVRSDGRYDACPSALAGLPPDQRLAASTPTPAIPPLTDILLDGWSMTTLRGHLPGRPPVADWLHGVAEWEPPEALVAWREEVEHVTGDLLHLYPPDELLEDWPLTPHEIIRDRVYRVGAQLDALAAREPDKPVWVVDSSGRVHVATLSLFAQRSDRSGQHMGLAGSTVLLPPSVGGLSGGLLDGAASRNDANGPYDVSGATASGTALPRRLRLWDDSPPPAGYRLARTMDVGPGEDGVDGEGAASQRFWRWYVRPRDADDDGSVTALVAQPLDAHLAKAEHFASEMGRRLSLGDGERVAVRVAARWHDLGKGRAIWQRSIGNRAYPSVVLAKSGNTRVPREITRYRHEFGSMLDVRDLAEFQGLSQDVQELVLHLIAAHHGRARPHFEPEEAFDPANVDEVSATNGRDVMARFARLQRKYGRWGLAYLESLVRAADALASQDAVDVASSGFGGADRGQA